MIEVTQLTKSFGDFEALRGVSFQIEPGQVCGYLGPNGAGKSTTVRMLMGLLRPTSGSAQVAGFDVVEQPLEVKRRVGYVPETAKVFSTLTCEEYLTLVGTLHDVAADQIDTRMRELLKLFQIHESRTKPLETFSKGMKQKVVLTAALLHAPQVLIFDEPLSGLDVNAVGTVKELIRQMANDGKTVFYSSHVLDVVERLCDRVLILSNGELVADGSPRSLIDAHQGQTLEQVFQRYLDIQSQQADVASFVNRLRPKLN